MLLEHTRHAFQAGTSFSIFDTWFFEELLLHLAPFLAYRRCGLGDSPLFADAYTLDITKQIQDQSSLLPLLHTLPHDVIDTLVY